VLFGLSMDYQVFLVSRIKERYDAIGDTRQAVTFGVASTARIITGAALIIVAVFAGFAQGELIMLQQMGFGTDRLDHHPFRAPAERDGPARLLELVSAPLARLPAAAAARERVEERGLAARPALEPSASGAR